MTSTSVKNHFETGIVDIRLEEYQINENGDEVDWSNQENILPGDMISKIPRIFNDGNDCYVRAKITIRGNGDMILDDLSGIKISGISDSWILSDDGYYYYTNVLAHGTWVDLFNSVVISENLPDSTMGKKFWIDIDVDAIQSKNVTPQYETSTPWGSIVILECEKEGLYDVSTFKQSDSKSFQIVYQGEIKTFFKNSEDFFENFPYMMPGDTHGDTAIVENDSERDIKLYFRSEALDSSELLDKILLKITTNIDGTVQTVYDGTLRATELSNDVVLGVIPSGENGTFHFELKVPEELNNQYTILNSYVKWIFSTEPILDIEEAPATGDTSSTILCISIIGIVCSLCLCAICLFKFKSSLFGKKLFIFFGLVGVLFLLFTTKSVLAYLIDADTVVNEVWFGNVATSITEDFEQKPPVAGDEIKKIVTVKNTGNSECYVRVKALFSDSDMQKVCSVDWNTGDWAYNQTDGYYYYKKVLSSGATTTNLCTKVTISSNISSNATNLIPFDIIIYAESYQAEGFASYTEAWEHYQRNK